MRIIFISDLHLDESRPHITEGFYRFINRHCLQSPTKTDALYILGDFFESWVGDDYNSSLIDGVKTHLKKLTNAGTSVYFMHGNRDFLVGKDFCQDVGCQLIEDGTTINVNGEPILLMHGDNLCTLDTDYLAFRKMVRAPQWQQNFLRKPLTERIQIAKALREKSQQSSSGKNEMIVDAHEPEVSRQFKENKVLSIIHGHTHRPNIHISAKTTRYVLGDWDVYGWMIVADKSGINLEKFPISTD